MMGTVVGWLVRLAAVALAAFVILLTLQSIGPPVSTLMVARWIEGRPVDRRYVPLDRISPRLVAAVVLSEDGQFCRHHGVDWGALREVMRSAHPSRGASTLTMQVAKNLFLWPGRSYLRKAVEIPVALVLDAVWSKRHILEVYLNIAEWGEGVYGAEAAAAHSFKSDAASLNARQAALLATALPNPFLRDPGHPSRLQHALTQRLIGRMPNADEVTACLH